MGESQDFSTSACEDVLSQERGRAHHTPSAEGWSLPVLCWTHMIPHQSFKSKRAGFLPSPQPDPRLQSQDTLACHRASPHHLLEVGAKSSTLFPKLRPEAQHEASTAHQQPGMCYRLSGGQERGKSKQQVTLLGFVHACVWTVNLRAASFHQGANYEEKSTVKCYHIFFLARWTETKCIWYPYWHMASKEQGLSAYLPVKYK